LSVSLDTDANVRISWPSGAGDYVLQSTSAVPGGWTDDPAPVVEEGVNQVVTVQPNEAAKYYRLRR
jgi:hypothetical protein